jgi:hypothetical protein
VDFGVSYRPGGLGRVVRVSHAACHYQEARAMTAKDHVRAVLQAYALAARFPYGSDAHKRLIMQAQKALACAIAERQYVVKQDAKHAACDTGQGTAKWFSNTLWRLLRRLSAVSP